MKLRQANNHALTPSLSRRLGWVGVTVAVSVALTVAIFGQRSERNSAERALDLAAGFACKVCEGQSVADSQSAFATVIRAEISRRVTAGQTDREITDFLVATNGAEISLKPKSSGIEALIWIVPVVAAVTALAGLAVVFRGWSRRDLDEPDDDDRVLVERARRQRLAGT